MSPDLLALGVQENEQRNHPHPVALGQRLACVVADVQISNLQPARELGLKPGQNRARLLALLADIHAEVEELRDTVLRCLGFEVRPPTTKR